MLSTLLSDILQVVDWDVQLLLQKESVCEFDGLLARQAASAGEQHLDPGRQGTIERIAVPSTKTVCQALESCIESADMVLAIAPESEGILLKICRQVLGHGKIWIGCDLSLIELASDKAVTADWLRAQQLPAIEHRLLDSGEGWPTDWGHFPCVLKPRDGVGGQYLHVFGCSMEAGQAWRELQDADPAEHARPRQWMIQPLVPGLAFSSCFAGALPGPQEAPKLPGNPLSCPWTTRLPAQEQVFVPQRFGEFHSSRPLTKTQPELAAGAAMLDALVDSLRAAGIPTQGLWGVDGVLADTLPGSGGPVGPVGINSAAASRAVIVEINPRFPASWASVDRWTRLAALQQMLSSYYVGWRSERKR